MEFLNKIELQGIVGNTNTNNVGDTSVTRFSVCTENSYKSNDGCAVVDCTWHNCIAWASPKNNLSGIKRGAWVHLVGRLRVYRFTSYDGTERTGTEVFVNEVSVLSDK